MTDRRPENPNEGPARVILQIIWKGLTHKHEWAALPHAATHYAMDKAIWDASVAARRKLVEQEYPNADLTSARRGQSNIRNEFEAFGAIRSYLNRHEGARFELVAPDRNMPTKWRAHFKGVSERLEVIQGFCDVEMNPPVGIGSVDYIAIENLLRFTEGREPIDG